MGCFYTKGYFKIGESEKPTPSARLSNIRSSDSFQCLGWLRLYGETKAQRLFVESYVRMMMEQNPELTHVKNDHYSYTITSKEEKYNQAYRFANEAISYAIKICNLIGISYARGDKTYKRS